MSCLGQVYLSIRMLRPNKKSLYREMADAGIETALHLNGLRYSRLTGEKAKWLGEMTYPEQKDAIAMAKQDLENVTGKPCNGYRACYGSANDDTFKILDELGFTLASNARGRYRTETFANWCGSWPYPHRASDKSKLIPGRLNVFEFPVTCGVATFLEGDRNKPFDLRVETPVALAGEDRSVLRQVIDENLDQMQRMSIPVHTIVGASHNTSDYGDFACERSQNLRWIVRHTQELCQQHNLKFVATSFEKMLAEAHQIDSY